MGLAGCNQSHAWGARDDGATSRADQGIAAFFACSDVQMPQISHMLPRLLERCEARIAPATLAAVLLHPAGVRLTLTTGCPSCASCVVVGAWRWRRWCWWTRADTATLATIFPHPAGVPLTLSAGCPIWAILIPIGACRGRGRGRRRTWSWLRTCGTPLTIASPFAIAPALTAPSPLTISSTASMAAEPRARRRLGGRRCWCQGGRGLRQERTNRSNESVLEGDPSVGMILPQISGCALRTTGTITALHAWIGRWPVQRIRRIQPQHVDMHIIPERNRHDVATVQRLTHGRRTPLFCVIVHVPEEGLRSLAPSIRDAVGIARSQERRRGIRDHVAVLDVIPHYLGERPLVRPIGGEELSHDSHGLRRVDYILGATAEEHPVAQPVWVHITAVFVADTIIPLASGIVATIGALTPKLPGEITRMRSVRIRHAVRLPDVHLCTASAVLAISHAFVGVMRVGNPIHDVGFARDPLDVVWALSVAVSRPEVGACVVSTLALAPLRVHLYEIHRAVHPTEGKGDIEVHCEFAILQVEHLVLLAALIQHVQA